MPVFNKTIWHDLYLANIKTCFRFCWLVFVFIFIRTLAALVCPCCFLLLYFFYYSFILLLKLSALFIIYRSPTVFCNLYVCVSQFACGDNCSFPVQIRRRMKETGGESMWKIKVNSFYCHVLNSFFFYLCMYICMTFWIVWLNYPVGFLDC